MHSVKEIKIAFRVAFGTPQGRSIVLYRPAALVAGGIALVIAISVVAEVGILLIS